MNKEKALITDLSQLRKQEEKEPFLIFAETIIKQIKLGKNRDEILHMILKADGGLEADPREMKYFTDLVDIVYKWYYENDGKEFQDTVKELLEEMDANQKYLYNGKNGKNYATRASLDEADKDYMNKKIK